MPPLLTSLASVSSVLSSVRGGGKGVIILTPLCKEGTQVKSAPSSAQRPVTWTSSQDPGVRVPGKQISAQPEEQLSNSH